MTWLTTGPAGVGGDGSTLWVFWNKSALRADLRVFQSIGCRALGCVVPRGPRKHPSTAPWGALYRQGVTQDTRPHLHKGHRLDLGDDGTRSRGRGGSTLWVFWNKSALRADLRVFQSVGCRGLGCVVPRGPPKHSSAGPLGASYRRGVTKDARPHLRKGHRFDLVDDGTRSRGRGRLDVMGFLEQVRTSCGPQSLSKRMMPGLGVCGSSGSSKTPLRWPLGSIVPSGGHKGHSATP